MHCEGRRGLGKLAPMDITAIERDMLEGREGPAKQRAMKGLVQLGRDYGAPRLVEIGYAHIHAGMALYLEDVELMEELDLVRRSAQAPHSESSTHWW